MASTAARSRGGDDRGLLPGGQRGPRFDGRGESQGLARRQHTLQGGQRGITQLPAVGVGHGGAIVVAAPRPKFPGRPQQEQARCAAAGLLDRLAHRPDVIRRDQPVAAAEGRGMAGVVDHGGQAFALPVTNTADQDSIIGRRALD